MRSALLVLAAMTVVAVAALGYVRIGWDRMESHCGGDTAPRGYVSYSWDWEPLGFTCTYRSGDHASSETSLWF